MRHFLRIRNSNRYVAHGWVEKCPEGWLLEVKEPTRTLEQNAALWSLLGQIQKQRPTHNGVDMTRESWKAVFMDALGMEVEFLPKLDGKGFFPAGHRSSQLTTPEFSNLIELILAWCAEQGLEIEHFDG